MWHFIHSLIYLPPEQTSEEGSGVQHAVFITNHPYEYMFINVQVVSSTTIET